MVRIQQGALTKLQSDEQFEEGIGLLPGNQGVHDSELVEVASGFGHCTEGKEGGGGESEDEHWRSLSDVFTVALEALLTDPPFAP